MAGVKGKSGGKRPNQTGRPPKADEVALIERLSPMDDLWLEKMSEGLEKGEFPFVKMFAEYRFGKPKERLDVTTDGDKVTGFTIEVLHEAKNSNK